MNEPSESPARALPNGGLWPDVAGVHVNAHGGGLLKEGGLWYWYGEHKTAGRAGNAANVGVRVYSSPDLLGWTDRGVALAVDPDEASDIARGCILERPKVVKAATGRFVMFFHLERKGLGYTDARVGIAVADRPEGPFAFVRSLRPHGEFCRDMTLFRDDDGSTWHVFASEDNATLHVAELTPDCLDYTGRWWRMAEKTWTEAPAVFKHDGWYHLLGSGCTGWAPNAARSFRARRMSGPWEPTGNPCRGVNPANGLGPEKTWGAQSTFAIPPDETTGGRWIAMFDLWRPEDAIDGRYAWLPADFRDGRLGIAWHDTFPPGKSV